MAPKYCPSGKIDIFVRIEENIKTKQLVWYYNNLSSDNFRLGVQINVGHIIFRFDENTAKRFVFLDPTITFKKGARVYQDLTEYEPIVGKDYVIILDTQKNGGYAEVGSITLYAQEIGLGGEMIGEPLSSDPEIINTGYETCTAPNK
ncbi:hypothetical protein [Nitrospirillum sp. BR 11163]|uniref:hypothetical protein n=1 Tax=Nitrospirillum sp. BR 11163 TaxID=3104323 RepID=UPI002AFFF992|nr:hypothetical protein [Nitrospirillum sp. BR 11163]MEA1672738.1 hypothetical protein [Nitrospirillum sp. BR 11163]